MAGIHAGKLVSVAYAHYQCGVFALMYCITTIQSRSSEQYSLSVLFESLRVAADGLRQLNPARLDWAAA